MKILNQNEINMIGGGSNTNGVTNDQCYEVHGYHYLTPEGNIEFNGIKITSPDGTVRGLGCIPDGWKLLSDEVVVRRYCE